MENIKTENKEMETIQGMNKKIYDVTIVLDNEIEGEENKSFSYSFKQPGAAQFTRYVKELSKNVVQASKNLVLSNVLQQDRENLLKDMEEYPGMVVSLSQKFLSMLGFTDNITFRRR